MMQDQDPARRRPGGAACDAPRPVAEPTKIGMITTLSGGGAGLGIDVRDGFMLALKQAATPPAEIEVIAEDDQQKPDVAVQLADKMIQSDQVDILTGIIFSNLAMAVVPARWRRASSTSRRTPARRSSPAPGCNENYFNVAWQNDNLHEAAGAHANELGYKKTFILAPNYPAGTDALNGFKRFYKGELAGELYTKIGQTDFAAEIAQIKASRRRQRVLLPARRHGHRLHQAVRAVRDRHPADRPRLLVLAGHPRRGRRGGARRAQHRPVVARPRQRGQQGLRRGVPGRVRPPALALRQPGLRHRQPDPLGARQGAGQRRRRLPRGARGGRVRLGPRRLQVRHRTTTRSRTSTPARWSRRTACITNRIIGVALEDHADAFAAECKM